MSLGNLTAKVGLQTAGLSESAGLARAELSSIGGANSKLGGEVSALSAKFKAGFSSMSSEASGLSKAMTIAGGVGVGLGVAVAAAAVAGIGKFESQTGEVRKLKAALGSTAEEASGMRNVAVGLGIDVNKLSIGTAKLSVNLIKTSGDLAGVHVETARNSDGTANLTKTWDNLRTAYQSIQDPQQKNIFLQQALAKGGIELRGVLSATNAEYEKMKARGPIYSDKDLKAGRDLGIAQRELGASISTVEVALARGLVPALTAAAHAATSVVDAVGKIHLPIGEIVTYGGAALVAAKSVSILGAATSAMGATWAGSAIAAAAGLTSAAVALSGGLLIAARAADSHVGSLKSVDSTMIGLERRIPLVGGFLADLDAKTTGATNSAKKHSAAVEEASAKFEMEKSALADVGIEVDAAEIAQGALTKEHQAAAKEAEKYAKTIDAMGASVSGAFVLMGGAADSLSGKERDQAKAFDGAKSAADSLKQGLDILIGVHLTAEETSIAWEKAIDDTTTKLRENKATLDIKTQAGRENETQIISLIKASLANVDALQREGASSEAVSVAYGSHVDALRAVMSQAGYTEDQISALLNKYNLLAGAPDIRKNIDIYQNTYYSGNQQAANDVGSAFYNSKGYETGGIIDKPTFAIMGEKGKKELVLPLTDMSRTFQLLNQAGLVKPFPQPTMPSSQPATSGAVPSMTINGAAPSMNVMVTPAPVTIVLDGKTIASGTVRFMVDEMKSLQRSRS